MKHHLNNPVIPTRRQPRARPRPSHGRNIPLRLLRTSRPPIATTTTTKQPLQQLPRNHPHPRLPLLLITAATPQSPRDIDLILHANRRVGASAFRSCRAGTHEGGDHGCCIDGSIALGAAEGSDGAGADLAVPDDGGVGLGAAAVGGAGAGGAVGDFASS